MKGGAKALEYPYQCTGCPAVWYDSFVENHHNGSREELQERHRIIRCWRYPHEAYHHVVLDLREPIPSEYFEMEATHAWFTRLEFDGNPRRN